MEIVPGVHQLAIGEGYFPPPNVFFVVGKNQGTFIDTGFGRDEEVNAYLDLWDRAGKPELAGIVLTHRHGDHIGGAGRLRAETGGEIVCHEDEREPIETGLDGIHVDRSVQDGETIDLGGVTLELIHTPGHTMGSLCVYYRERGILFTGDTVLGKGTTSIDPDHGDMALYLKSLGRIARYDTKLIGPGHGEIVHHPEEKIKLLIQHRHSRERRILGLIQNGHTTVDQLFAAIYARLDLRLHNSAHGQLMSHLTKLEREGGVSRNADGTYTLI